MYSYLLQNVWCVRRPGRIFQREVAVAENAAVVTRVETIPQGYEGILLAQRNPNEGILEARIPLDESRYDGCPYCGNKQVFTCSCGALSCHARDDREHYCPACRRMSNVVYRHNWRASNSGFVEQAMLLPGREGGGQQLLEHFIEKEGRREREVRRLLAPPDDEPGDPSPWNRFRRRK